MESSEADTTRAPVGALASSASHTRQPWPRHTARQRQPPTSAPSGGGSAPASGEAAVPQTRTVRSSEAVTMVLASKSRTRKMAPLQKYGNGKMNHKMQAATKKTGAILSKQRKLQGDGCHLSTSQAWCPASCSASAFPAGHSTTKPSKVPPAQTAPTPAPATSNASTRSAAE